MNPEDVPKSKPMIEEIVIPQPKVIQKPKPRVFEEKKLIKVVKQRTKTIKKGNESKPMIIKVSEPRESEESKLSSSLHRKLQPYVKNQNSAFKPLKSKKPIVPKITLPLPKIRTPDLKTPE